MGLYSEKNWHVWPAFLLLALAFVVIYLPWISPDRELFRQEDLLAVEAMEFSPRVWVVTAHNVAIKNAAPLFPVAASLLHTWGIPIESALRGISLFMLAAGAVVVYFAAASQRSSKAGLVASAVYLTSLFSMEKAIDGVPTTTSAFFLLSAQLVFFYYGVRRANWNKAWILATILVSLGFLSGGLPVLVYFITPMFFFRRPLSVRSKFKKPGFAAAVILLCGVLALLLVPYHIFTEKNPSEFIFNWEYMSTANYFKDLLEFPFILPLRLLPWSFIAWLPFCVALQTLDKTPIFSRYLRTLTFVTLLLVWFQPNSDSRDIFYMLGPLAIQTGTFYELGMRRYGNRIRKFLVLGEIGSFLLAAAFIVVTFTKESWLTPFVSLTNTLGFRDTEFFTLFAAISIVLLLLITIAQRLYRYVHPVWVMLVLVSVSIGIFYGGVMAPYRKQTNHKRQLSADIQKAIAGEKVSKIYKSGINDLYGELYYTKLKVIKLPTLNDLPAAEETVYLIGTEFPTTTDRSWSNLLPEDYSYHTHRLSLWKGTLRKKTTEDFL